MDFYDLKNALFLGFFLSFMVGPVFFILIKTSILKGARAAIVFNFGVILGDISFIVIAYFGSRGLLEKIKDDPRLFFIGGLILVIYGLITYFDKSNKKNIDELTINLPVRNDYLRLMLKGFFINFINIGVLAFWLGLIVVIGPTLDMNPTHIFWYFVVIISSYFITDLGKILLAKQLKKKLTPRIIYKMKKTMGILLIIFGVALILKGFIPEGKLNINDFIEKIEK